MTQDVSPVPAIDEHQSRGLPLELSFSTNRLTRLVITPGHQTSSASQALNTLFWAPTQQKGKKWSNHHGMWKATLKCTFWRMTRLWRCTKSRTAWDFNWCSASCFHQACRVKQAREGETRNAIYRSLNHQTWGQFPSTHWRIVQQREAFRACFDFVPGWGSVLLCINLCNFRNKLCLACIWILNELLTHFYELRRRC